MIDSFLAFGSGFLPTLKASAHDLLLAPWASLHPQVDDDFPYLYCSWKFFTILVSKLGCRRFLVSPITPSGCFLTAIFFTIDNRTKTLLYEVR